MAFVENFAILKRTRPAVAAASSTRRFLRTDLRHAEGKRQRIRGLAPNRLGVGCQIDRKRAAFSREFLENP